jgi:hypothetical protein
MKNKILTLALIPVLSISVAFGGPMEKPEKPSISTSQKMKLTALVEAIDLEKREVTLRGPQGHVRTIQLGDTAPRLNEVEVGDTVLAEYVQNLSLEVMANDGTKPGGGVMSAVSRGASEKPPSVVVTDTSISTATVDTIDLENNTFRLDWGDGNIKEYVAQNPANLRKAAVGDLVVVTYTEALALSVQEIP